MMLMIELAPPASESDLMMMMIKNKKMKKPTRRQNDGGTAAALLVLLTLELLFKCRIICAENRLIITLLSHTQIYIRFGRSLTSTVYYLYV